LRGSDGAVGDIHHRIHGADEKVTVRALGTEGVIPVPGCTPLALPIRGFDLSQEIPYYRQIRLPLLQMRQMGACFEDGDLGAGDEGSAPGGGFGSSMLTVAANHQLLFGGDLLGSLGDARSWTEASAVLDLSQHFTVRGGQTVELDTVVAGVRFLVMVLPEPDLKWDSVGERGTGSPKPGVDVPTQAAYDAEERGA
jgi:hypothetical protein